MNTFVKQLALAACISVAMRTAQAGEVKIGFVNCVTGPLSDAVHDIASVTTGYLDMINAQGGINGNKLTLLVRDDHCDPVKTAGLAEELIEKEHVLALVNSAGTPTTMAVIKSRVLNRNRVPLVGVFSGAEAIRGPGSEEIFHTRPAYGEEIRKIARLASTLGLQRVAVLYQDDAFGQSIMQNIDASAKDFKLAVTARLAYKPGTKDFAPQTKQVEVAKPQAIFLMGAPDSAYQFMKAYNAPVGSAQIYALSFVAPKLLAATAGEAKVRGIGITQVVPNPNSATIPLVKDFQTFLNSEYGKGIVSSPVLLETYLNIRLLTEAIKTAGASPTGDKVMQSLASMQEQRIGGFRIDFANGKRNGSNYLDIAVVGANARLQY